MSFIESTLQPHFAGLEFSEDSLGNIKTTSSAEGIVGLLNRFHNELDFEVLSMISCRDLIEEDVLALNYIIYSYKHNQVVMIGFSIPRALKDDGSKRTIATLQSVQSVWPQANQFERELWEMYGISFTGHDYLKEFFLEDWQEIPPMRRDFDTLTYVEENFEFRIGRDDAKSVKEERKKIRDAKMAEKAAAEAKLAAEAPKEEATDDQK